MTETSNSSHRGCARPARSTDANGVAGGIAAPLLVEVELFERRLVARDEQKQRIPVRPVDVVDPGPAGPRERVERVPVEARAVDDRMAFAFEGSDEQARGLPNRRGALAPA